MSLIRRNPDLAAAALLALVTACFSDISLSSLRESINFPLLALLFSLMTIVAALRRAGFFSGLFCHLFQKPRFAAMVIHVRTGITRRRAWASLKREIASGTKMMSETSFVNTMEVKKERKRNTCPIRRLFMGF